MTLRSRFLLVGAGILIFVLSTPGIVLYALGYKLDYKNRSLTKTGSLIVHTRPDRANIFINDSVQTKRTDATVRFLTPGDLNIKIDKPGYQSWTKRLTVRSGLVTWANQDRDFITLFYEKPIVTDEKHLTASTVSQRFQDAVAIENDKSYLLNPNRGNLSQTNNPVLKFDPPTSVNQNTLYYLLKFPLTKILGIDQIKTARQVESNNTYVAALVGKNLIVYSNDIPQVVSQTASGFTLENDHLWFVEDSLLKHIQLGVGVVETITNLPFTPNNSQIIRGNSQIFMILDNNLYVMGDKVQEVYRGVDYAYWDNDANRLVFANNNEALLFDASTLRSELIIRSTTKITQPTINQTAGYLFFINEGKIKAIELDGRDHRNVYTIDDTPAESFLLSRDGKILTAFSETGMRVMEIRE